MKGTPPHLRVLEEIEEAGIPGLLEVLRDEGIDGVRCALWDTRGWHRDYSPPAWRNRATAEQKRVGWEMAVRIEKIVATVLDEATSGRSRRSWKPSARARRASTRVPRGRRPGRPGEGLDQAAGEDRAALRK